MQQMLCMALGKVPMGHVATCNQCKQVPEHVCQGAHADPSKEGARQISNAVPLAAFQPRHVEMLVLHSLSLTDEALALVALGVHHKSL